MSSIPNPADIRYGGFYLPIFSLLYIYQNIGLPVELPFPFLRIVVSEANFGAIVGFVFLSSLLGHGASRSIYGMEGAKTNPKNRWAVLWYRTLFTIKKTPGSPPLTIEDISDKLETSIDGFLGYSTTGKVLISGYRILRFCVVFPARLVFLSMVFLTTWVLGTATFTGTLEPLGTLLLIAQLIFFFGSWVFRRFPTAVPVDSAPWVYLAEYQKPNHLHKQGEMEFEYGPFDMANSIMDGYTDFYQNPHNRPHYHGKEDVSWTIPIEESSPQYLIKLEE